MTMSDRMSNLSAGESMKRAVRRGVAALAICAGTTAVGVAADEVKVFEENGVTYRETRRTTQRPLTETRWESQEQTVLTERYKTEQQTTYSTVQVPITEYRWEPYWANRWNPFSPAYIAYRYVPYTRYEARTSEIKTPVVRKEIIPTTRTVQVPVTKVRMVEDEVVSRVAIGTTGTTDPFAQPQASVAKRSVLGGTRLGGAPASQGEGWQSAAPTVRR